MKKKYKNDSFYNIMVNGDIYCREIFGFEVESELHFLEQIFYGRGFKFEVVEAFL